MFEGINKSLSSRVRFLIFASVLLTGLLFCVSTYFSLNSVREAVLKTGIEDAFSGVNQNIKLFDQLLYSQEEGWDAMFEERLPDVAAYIAQLGVVPSELSPETLLSIANDHGFSSLYIVNEDLVVVATSYAPEMGLDLKSFSAEYTAYLNEIQKSGLVHVDRVSTSSVTGKIKKYGYYNPLGSAYLINTDINVLETLSDDASYDFGDFLFRDLRKNIKEENNLVDAFDLFIITEIDRWSMLNEGGTLEDTIAARIYDGESEVSTFQEDRTIYREVMLPNHDNPGVKFVAAVTFNEGVFSDGLVQNTAIVMILGLVLSLAASLVFSSLLFGRKFAQRLELITAGVSKMTKDQKFRISVSGRDDIAVAADAINELANQVEIRDTNLKDANQDLERKVMERTRELLVAKQEAEQSNRAKSEFLAAMSHDLRTPLNAIIGFSEMMRDKYFGPLGDKRYDEYTKDIHKSGTLLVSLIDDILDLSKIEAEKYSLAEERLDLNKVIRESITQNTLAADAKQQIIRVDLSDDCPALLADHRAILQILNNVLSNAIKFSGEGEKIDLRVGLDRDGGIVLTVIDRGIGISPKDIGVITQPFMQIQSSHSIAREGSGLGLYLVSSLMTLHGGELDVESKLGEGTSIKLTFPPERTIVS